MSNAEEFGEWLGEVRGDVAVVVSEIRPVPLWQHVMVGKQLFDLFVEESLDSSGRPQEGRRVQVNPELLERILSLIHI